MEPLQFLSGSQNISGISSARRPRHGHRSAADKRDELAPFSIGRIAFSSLPARAELRDIELAMVSQAVSRHLHNRRLLAKAGYATVSERPQE